jgi:hypothetical protein
MFAPLAALSFAIAFILHLIGHGAAKFVIDFELAGFILVSLHLWLGWPFSLPGRRVVQQ